MNKNIDELQERKKENSKISNGVKIWFFLVALIHIGLAIFACIRYKFPVFSWKSLVFISLILLPSGIIAFILITNKKTIIRVALLVLCVVCIPVSLFLSFHVLDCSETSNVNDYLNMDLSSANVDWLFPKSIPKSYNEQQLDGSVGATPKYYYYYTGGKYYHAYDVYAEFTLSREEFDMELERVGRLYDEYKETYGSNLVFEIKYGEYNCFIATTSPRTLFVDTEHKYTYVIFAYDEQMSCVRYIVCTNLYENKPHHPYYLQLDWQ